MKKKEILASESFSASAKRHYFIDLKRAENNSKYLQLTRSEQQQDGSYKRWSFVVFEDHLTDFISAFASLFQAAAYQDESYQTVQDIAAEYKAAKGIKAMPEDSRPREKVRRNCVLRNFWRYWWALVLRGKRLLNWANAFLMDMAAGLIC